MKRPLYYLLCAIACTSMVSSTLPMAAIAEAIQPRATTEQQAQADATSIDTGEAEDGTNTNATADSAEDSTATSTGTSQTDPADANTADAATPGTTAPSLRAQTNGTPETISTTSQTTYAHSATATQNGVTFTVSWNDAPAGAATTFHVTQTNGSSQAKARMDVPTYWDGGSQESVCDPSRPAWGSYHSLGATGHDFTFDFTASGTYRIYFYFMDNDRYDPQNDKGIYYLRTTAEVTVNDAARPSVTQIVNNAVDQCRQQTNGSEYDMALWLHDWTLDQLEYDHSLNWCSAESGLTRHQGTCESYQRIYSKLLDAAGIANGRITGNGHTWNAVKIDGKWCQMDLTWDDTSDNWYGDLEQRLTVARAIYSGSPVLLLDECTSALDPKTEREMLGRMRNLGRTAIIVTHRPALEVCNRVVSLEPKRGVDRCGCFRQRSRHTHLCARHKLAQSRTMVFDG